jgi:hypothetical protein
MQGATAVKRKINIEFDDEALDTLERLREGTNAPSVAAVLRDALGVYSSLYDMLPPQSGKRLALIDRDTGQLQQLHVPSLSREPVLVFETERSSK